MPDQRTDSTEVRYTRTSLSPRVRDEVLREVVDSIPAPTILVDADRFIRYSNACAAKLFGYDTRDIEALSVDALVPDAPFLVQSTAGATIDLFPRVFRSISARSSNGAELHVEVSLRPLELEEDPMVVLTFCDISRQVVAEREIVRLAGDLRQRLEELGDAIRAKDLLLREIHHRVKNNLQIVSSLLSLQSRQVRDPDARRLFEDSRDRLVSMSLIHEQLYRGSDLGRVDFAAYLRNLIVGIARGYVDALHGIDISVRAEPIELAIDRAVPAGLIVHELVSNALKHAFPEGGPGSIVVSLVRLEGGSYELGIADDGVGTPTDPPASFGMRLVSLLVRQLDAEIDVSTERGTSVRIRFRDSDPEELS